MNKIQEIIAKVIDVNPSIQWECSCEATESNPEAVCKNMRSGKPCREIRVADILMALTPNGGSRFNVVTYRRGELGGTANILREDRDKFINWNLRHDDLEEQSPETIETIANTLGL